MLLRTYTQHPRAISRLKVRTEEVAGNRRIAVNSHRHQGFSKHGKMRLREVKVMFYRVEIKSMTSNVAEVNIRNVGGGIKTPHVATKSVIRPGDILVPS